MKILENCVTKFDFICHNESVGIVIADEELGGGSNP